MLLPIILVLVFAVVSPATLPEEQPEGEVHVRERRFAALSLYLCGSYPHQFASSYPCGPCINCGSSCALSCTSSYYCQSFHSSLSCMSGCCTTPSYPSYMYSPPVVMAPSISLMPATQCVGPCVNSMCPSGFTCTAANLCCA